MPKTTSVHLPRETVAAIELTSPTEPRDIIIAAGLWHFSMLPESIKLTLFENFLIKGGMYKEIVKRTIPRKDIWINVISLLLTLAASLILGMSS